MKETKAMYLFCASCRFEKPARAYTVSQRHHGGSCQACVSKRHTDPVYLVKHAARQKELRHARGALTPVQLLALHTSYVERGEKPPRWVEQRISATLHKNRRVLKELAAICA